MELDKKMIGNRIKVERTNIGLTQEELANKLGLNNKSSISQYEKGDAIPSDDIKIQMCNLFNCTIDYLLCKTDIKNIIVSNSKIPVLGTVKAGYDWLAEENIVEYITLKENLPNKEEYYALKITGDSMLPLLTDGDLVIVHDQDDVESGQTAIVLINGDEATVKKVIKTNDGIELHAMNPYYPVRKFTFEDMEKIPIKIIGRVKEAKIKGAFE